jgi:hypothetical protein
MARLLTIDVCTVQLRNALLATLRPEDEGLLLPQASQSVESGIFKNCVFRLSGDATNVNAAIFSPDWFCGVSVVQLKELDAKMIELAIDDEAKRKALLQKLVDAIPSEISDPDLQVGPALECDDLERDLPDTKWQFGLDTPSSFVGIFSAEHSKSPDVGKQGMNRVHREFFLVCKAGAGVAASTFHARLIAAASKGLSLDAIFAEGGALGAQALRRLSSAGTRNRHRILLAATEALGLKTVESVGDQASKNRYRGAVVDVDVVCNSLRKLDDASKSTWQFCSAVDGAVSKGLVALSNAADGVVLFLHQSGDKRIALKNETWASMPFSTQRLVGGRDIVKTVQAAKNVHTDEMWIRKRFGWKNREFGGKESNSIPFSLWGSHATETFTKSFARELGIADLNAVRLRPELVCVGGVESGKLRALLA